MITTIKSYAIKQFDRIKSEREEMLRQQDELRKIENKAIFEERKKNATLFAKEKVAYETKARILSIHTKPSTNNSGWSIPSQDKINHMLGTQQLSKKNINKFVSGTNGR